ncbi:MAG TPA: putative lipid II flippase FtsW [Candidatus Saccharimonadia bacterium]|nr:putative lipid II flippase FtsW [Candidatus Saccharimonadia bacterium]
MSPLSWPRSIQALRRDELPGRIDPVLLFAALALAGFGLVMVASSSIAIAEGAGVAPLYFVIRHAMFLAMGVALAFLVVLVPLAWLEQASRVLLLGGFVLLLAVFVPGVGHKVNGATRWINFGVTTFQAVEAVKLIVIVYLASYLVRFGSQVRTSLLGTIKPLAIAAMLVGLLLVQPDFGSAALLLAIVIGMIWLAGARVRDVTGLALLGTPVMAIAAWTEPYRVKRLTSFLDPWADPFKDGFQLSQALIAIGRGEWVGVGLGASIQKLYYLPEAHTDFILAVIAEELGLVGVVLVLALFALLAGRAFTLGLRAIESGLTFAGYCAFGIALWIGVQSLVSVGVNLGVLPTKGLTLPLISSGGSSLLMTCAAIGLLLRIGYETTRREAELAISLDDVEGAG